METIIKQVRTSLIEREDDLLRAWSENIEEADANEKNFPPLKIGMSAVIDLEGDLIETVIRFTSTYKTSLKTALPDPDQMEFPGIGESGDAWPKQSN
jgi:hypothetical protein